MRKHYLIPLVVSGLLVFGAACTKERTSNNSGNDNSAAVENINALADNTNSAVVGDTNEGKNTNADQATTNTNRDENTNPNSNNETVTTSSALTVDHPEKNKELESPFEVAGKSAATTVYARVKNASGVTLFTETLAVRDGEYHANLTFSFTHTSTGTVELYEKDSAGNEINLMSVPVTFKVETSGDQSTTNTNSNEHTNSDDTNENLNVSTNTNY